MARKPTAKQVAGLKREDHLRAKLVDLEEWLETSEAKRNGAAYIAGIRLATQLRTELHALENPIAAPATDPTAGMTDAQVVTVIADSLRTLPVHVLDDVLDAIAAERVARRAPDLRVVDGGP